MVLAKKLLNLENISTAKRCDLVPSNEGLHFSLILEHQQEGL
jgi:hypothetical protein